MEIRHAVVTGGGSGLGRAFCLEIARNGGIVVVADRNEESARETADLIESRGGRAEVVRVDVSSAQEMMELGEFARRVLPQIDLLVNNAGVVAGGEIGTIPLEEWRWLLSINLDGVIHGCHVFAPLLRQQRHGAILNVASVAGLISAPLLGPYNVSKAGVVALSETLHSELRRYGVGVTVLCPSFFQTRLLESMPRPDPELVGAAARQMAAGRLKSDDVARRALAAVRAGLLYALPMPEGRFVWWFKRLAPALLARILGSRRFLERVDLPRREEVNPAS